VLYLPDDGVDVGVLQLSTRRATEFATEAFKTHRLLTTVQFCGLDDCLLTHPNRFLLHIDDRSLQKGASFRYIPAPVAATGQSEAA
jgi:hypothetical protein